MHMPTISYLHRLLDNRIGVLDKISLKDIEMTISFLCIYFSWELYGFACVVPVPTYELSLFVRHQIGGIKEDSARVGGSSFE